MEGLNSEQTKHLAVRVAASGGTQGRIELSPTFPQRSLVEISDDDHELGLRMFLPPNRSDLPEHSISENAVLPWSSIPWRQARLKCCCDTCSKAFTGDGHSKHPFYLLPRNLTHLDSGRRMIIFWLLASVVYATTSLLSYSGWWVAVGITRG